MSNTDPTKVALYLTGELLDQLPNGTHIYKLDLHKILYLVQANLGEDNDISKALPFYWYLHGPVSQPAFDAGTRAARTGVASVEETGDATKFMPGPETPPEPSIGSADLDEAVDQLGRVVEEYRFREQRDRMLQDEIYVDAPYEFQPEFKFTTLPALQNFACEENRTASDLEQVLYRAEGKLPLDPAFEAFNTRFSRFVSLADTFLTAETNEYPLLRAELTELTETTWQVFCNRLRYETASGTDAETLERWEQQANQSLATYEQSLTDFESRLLDAGIYAQNASRATENEPWAKVTKSILNES
ncbi:hypothetical protein [Natranaeroarchaeum aerophilus]|uniref:DUF4065 domain-containing protein n=1 Tax=Natranaeroarchaeum aerophilus TaxID=2917711 RepID=A0AAE3FSY3_9EURY|nr:hypothetical protein [Natranaeroarchaeum aerophilus]MCL9814353.1 hypothetical protein [Natranaeroarchaeum aerophilus]